MILSAVYPRDVSVPGGGRHISGAARAQACSWEGAIVSITSAETWKPGYGPLVRQADTVTRIEDMAQRLVRRGLWPDEESVYRLVAAAVVAGKAHPRILQAA